MNLILSSNLRGETSTAGVWVFFKMEKIDAIWTVNNTRVSFDKQYIAVYKNRFLWSYRSALEWNIYQRS